MKEEKPITVVNMTQKECDRELAEITEHIKAQPVENEIKTPAGGSDLGNGYKVQFYNCRNKHGHYHKYEISQNDKVIDTQISLSHLTLCKTLNKWMRKNKI